MLICIPIFALARYDLILPLRILVLVTGVLQIATALLLYRLIRSALSPPVAMLASAYWAFNTYILLFLYKTGVESCIALFFIALLLYLTHRFEQSWRAAPPSSRHFVILAAVAALAVFSRLDLIFFALVMGFWIVLRESPLRYLLPLDLLAIFVSTLTAFVLRLGFAGYYEVTTLAITMASAGFVISIPVYYLFGLYSRPSTWRPLQLAARILISTLFSGVLLSGLLLGAGYLRLIPTVSRAILALNAAITLGLILLIRLTAYLFRVGRETTASEPALNELKARWRVWLRNASVYYGILGGALALYMVWNKLTFGSFSPVSGQVKRWWGTFLISVYGGPAKSWLSFLGIDPYGEFNAWQPATRLLRDWTNNLLFPDDPRIGAPGWQQSFLVILAVAFVVVLILLLVTRRSATRSVVQAGMIPLFVGSWLQSLSYNATGYASPKEWYWLTEQVLLVILGALLLNVVYELILKRWEVTRIGVWALVAAYVVWQGASYWRDAYELSPYGHSARDAAYAPVVPFIEEHTAPGDIIGMTGGGNVAYFIHDRTIVNMDGLINSADYFKGLQDGTGAEYLFETGMRYVFANPAILKANPYRGQYDGRLKGIASWGGKDLMKLLADPSK